MNQQPTYNPFELLRRWLQGETPLQEERQLEQLAEEDPFLAEALEGYRSHPEGRHAEYVERLKGRLAERTRKRRSMLFYLPRAAAAAVLLAIAAGGFWYINHDGSQAPALAIQEKQTEESRATAPESAAKPKVPEATGAQTARKEALPSPAPEKKEPSPPSEPAAPAAKETPALLNSQDMAQGQSTPAAKSIKPAPAAPPPTLPKAIRPEPAADDVELYSVTEDEIAAVAEKVTEDQKKSKAITRAAPAAPGAKQLAPAAAQSRTIAGTVTGPDGEPLIGASIVQKGTSRGVVTNLDGKFSLEVPDSDLTLLITYTGFESQEIKLGMEDSLAIALTEGGDLLDAVVVSGYANEREAPQSAPQPKEGFVQLRQYIRDNLQYPEAARQNGIEGKVVLRFRIRPDGSLFDFQVKKGPGYGCKEEAIRLLKEGPKWDGAGQEVTYTIRFKL